MPLLRFGDEVVHRADAQAAVLRDVELADRAAGTHRLEHGVRSGDRLTRFVRRGRATRRAGGRAADLLGVLRAAATEARTHPATGRRAERRARSPAAGRAA